LILINDGLGERDIIQAQRRAVMQDIKVDEELWASSMLPEGIVERWFIGSGTAIKAGKK